MPATAKGDMLMSEYQPTPAPHGSTIPPIIGRLETEHGYPRLATLHDVAEFLTRPGFHCLFIPGDARRNLETADAAVILPELRLAFQNGFDCAIIDDAVEAQVREQYNALKTPGFVFFKESTLLGDIQKVRDWSEYLARITHILSLKAA